MRIADIIKELENWAPRSWQESYDNAGLIIGDKQVECTGVLCALDATESIIEEAHLRGCNLVVAHHPIVFSGLKRIDPDHYVGRTLIRAIKHDIAIYAIHTNLDNLLGGVNAAMADQLDLVDRRVLLPKQQTLKKLCTFVPAAQVDAVSTALFNAGAGHIGRYDQCSFRHTGEGTFRGLEGANPFVGTVGDLHREAEWKLEVLYPSHLESVILNTLRSAHPYEEVAYDLIPLSNTHPEIGAGLIGELKTQVDPNTFLETVKSAFGCAVLRHTLSDGRPIRRVALCGGAGSFLVSNALSVGADAYLTADLKYHEFFDADGKMLLVDLGHYESEQFTTDLIQRFLAKKFPTFAVLKTDRSTNPIRYR